ncbi:N-acetyltransferase family protein [Shimia sp. W99]|jgi:GNAT superfamily N-acetyltransferase|uniref:GNAT family N-acetyltransferase n=1 Tax=Paracoccaceae TaxID=31989 RepID=UPI0029554535|nr:GNAT family N-acetyltransferase [Thioclava sp. A2]MDV7271802.1 GNAT family N-acetyltransferase [Thioclava sp. A2]
MTTTVIRRIKEADKAEWQMLWCGYNAFYEREVEDRTTDRVWDALKGKTGEPFCFVAEQGGKLVGFTHYFYLRSTSDWGPRCYMQDLFVDPSVRGGGVGQSLIEAVYADADENDAAQTFWLTTTTNKAARKLYDRVASMTPFVKYRR